VTRNALVTDLVLAVLAAIGADLDARRGDRPDDRDSRAVRLRGQFRARLAPEIVERGEAADDQRACSSAPEVAGASVRRDCSPCRRWPI
jgi:hypothetical protein